MRKGEHGELVVYADSITRRDTNAEGEDTERTIPFLKGYTVFNAEQCENLPAHFTAKPEAPSLPIIQHIEAADRFFDATGAVFRHGGNRAYYAEGADLIQMPPCETFRDAGATPRPARTNSRTGPSMRSASRGTSGASISATKAMRVKSWLPNSDQRSSVPISASRPRCATIMRPISRHGSRC